MTVEKLFMEIKDKEEICPISEIENLSREIEKLLVEKEENLDEVDRVFLARYKDRPKGLDFIENLIQDPIYLHGDRYFAEDSAIVCGIGMFDKEVVSFIGIHKGRNMEESVKCNFGMVHPEGYRKAVRIMKQAEKFQRPLLIFIDTPGAYPGVGAEERGQAESIASSMYTMTKLNTRIISVITGEGASGGAIALGISDTMLMMENAIYSILSPEGFASILWRDSTKAKEAMKAMKLTSYDLLKAGVADKVVKEKLVYKKEDFEPNFLRLKKEISLALDSLLQIDMQDLLQMRKDRFRRLKWD